jgi:hypothetical protein
MAENEQKQFKKFRVRFRTEKESDMVGNTNDKLESGEMIIQNRSLGGSRILVNSENSEKDFNHIIKGYPGGHNLLNTATSAIDAFGALGRLNLEEADLNTFTEGGVYFFRGDKGKTITNSPLSENSTQSVPSFLEVIEWVGSKIYKQIFYIANTTETKSQNIYVRTCFNGTWGPWSAHVNTSNFKDSLKLNIQHCLDCGQINITKKDFFTKRDDNLFEGEVKVFIDTISIDLSNSPCIIATPQTSHAGVDCRVIVSNYDSSKKFFNIKIIANTDQVKPVINWFILPNKRVDTIQ